MNVVPLFNMSVIVGIVRIEYVSRVVQLALPLLLLISIPLSFFFFQELRGLHRFMMEVME